MCYWSCAIPSGLFNWTHDNTCTVYVNSNEECNYDVLLGFSSWESHQEVITGHYKTIVGIHLKKINYLLMSPNMLLWLYIYNY